MISLPKGDGILYYGPDMVNVKSAYVDVDDEPSLPALRSHLLRVMRRNSGIGFAAPQVGVFKQVVLVETSPGNVLDLVNPVITRMLGKEVVSMEGCLSIPPKGNACRVPRMETITVEYSTVRDPKGRSLITLQGQAAAVAQHEIDHLYGTFYIDRVSTSLQRQVLEKFNQWKEEQYASQSLARPLTAARA